MITTTFFKKSVELEPDKKTMTAISIKLQERFFNSELNEILGFRKKTNSAATHLSEKPAKITDTDKVLLKCTCVDGSIANRKRENI